MKTNIEILLDNISFNVEEDAYFILKHYLDELKSKSTKDTDYIIKTEAQLAVYMTETNANPISKFDIERIIEKHKNLKSGSHVQKPNNVTEKLKPLFKNPEDKWIAGVCGGLAYFLSIPSIIVRLVFFVGLFVGSMSFWIYLLLWIGMRKPKTLEDFKALKHEKSSTLTNGHFLFLLTEMLKIFFRIGKKTLGVILFTIALVFIFILFTLYSGFTVSNFTINDLDFTSIDLMHFLYHYTPVNPIWLTSLYVSLVTLITTLLLYSMVWLGWLPNPKSVFRFFIILITIFAIGIIAFSAVLVGHTYKEEAKYTIKLMSFPLTPNKPIQIAAMQISKEQNKNSPIYFLNDSSLYIRRVFVRFVSSYGNKVEVYMTSSARDYNQNAALHQAKKIPYRCIQAENRFLLSDGFILNKNQTWQDQKITIEIHIPISTQVVLHKSMEVLLSEDLNINQWLHETPYAILLQMRTDNKLEKITNLGMDEIDNL